MVDKDVEYGRTENVIMDNIINIFSIILFLVCWILIVKKLIWNKVAPVKCVKAEVVDKYKPDMVSRYPGVSKQEKCIVVFKTKNEKLSFNVAPFSYDNYRIGEKGTLKYKGNQIISF